MNLNVLLSLAGLALLAGCGEAAKEAAPSAAKPALSVATLAPELLDWPRTLKAGGNIVAWHAPQ